MRKWQAILGVVIALAVSAYVLYGTWKAGRAPPASPAAVPAAAADRVPGRVHANGPVGHGTRWLPRNSDYGLSPRPNACASSA